MCLPPGTSVRGLESVPGKGYSHATGNNATVLWALTDSNVNGTGLVAYDGYDPAAPVLARIPLPPTANNATVTLLPGYASGFAIRNSAIHLLYTDGTLRRIKLNPGTGLPVAPRSPPALGFNMTAIALAANLTDRFGHQIVFDAVSGPIAVDATGTVFVNVAQNEFGYTGVFAVNTSNAFVGRQMRVQNPKQSGAISKNTPAGVKAMTTYVNGTGNSKLVVLEAGGAGRYLEFDLTTAGCGNGSKASEALLPAAATIANAAGAGAVNVNVARPPPPPPRCNPQNAKVTQVWNNIMPFGGVGSGWVYDLASHASGWGVRGGDLLKLDTNVSDGDWSISKAYEGVADRWVLYPNEYIPPNPPGGSHGNGPAFVERHGVTYLVLQMREKQVYKYASRAVQCHPHGGQFDFVWLSARTMHPHVGPQYVW